MLNSVEFYLFVFVTGLFWAGAKKLLTANKKLGIGAIAFVVLLWGFVLFQEFKFTSFESVAKDKLNEETTIQHMTIDVLENENSGVERSIVVENQEVIQQVLSDFSGVKLQKPQHEEREFQYVIKFLVTNPKGISQLETSNAAYWVGENYIDNMKIINEVNHLKTVREVVEGE